MGGLDQTLESQYDFTKKGARFKHMYKASSHI